MNRICSSNTSPTFLSSGTALFNPTVFGTSPPVSLTTPLPASSSTLSSGQSISPNLTDDPNNPVGANEVVVVTASQVNSSQYIGSYVNSDWGTNIFGDANGDYYRLLNGGPAANMTYNQITAQAGPNQDYANTCAALGRNDWNTATASVENDINKIVSGVPNTNTGNIAQGNANIAAMLGHAAMGLYDTVAAAAIAEASVGLQNQDIREMYTMDSAAASEACKVLDTMPARSLTP